MPGKAEIDESPYAADKELAAACMRGDGAALSLFEAQWLSAVPAYVARVNATPAFAAEVQQRLRVRLLVSEGGAPPKIASYTGRGPLAAWLRVAAIRTARDLVRGESPRVLRDDAEIALGQAGRKDPEIELLKRRYGPSLAEAFKMALACISAKERNVLRLYFMERLSSAAVGQLYGVQGATVRLWIKQCRAGLLDETRRILGERLRLEPSELDSVIRLAHSQLDVSIASLLGEG